MPRVRIRPRAEADLAEIWDFIADNSEKLADAFIDALNKRFLLLHNDPNWADSAMNWPKACVAFRLDGT